MQVCGSPITALPSVANLAALFDVKYFLDIAEIGSCKIGSMHILTLVNPKVRSN